MTFREQIENACKVLDLYPGIQACCKGKFRRWSDYQIRIMREVFKRLPDPSVIVGGREISKTFTIAVAYLIRCASEPGFEIYLVPGQKIDQASAALKYIQIIVKRSSILKPLSGLNRKNVLEWSTRTKSFLNGALMKALAPNEGVVSEHGCVWCDEYQFLPESVDEALQGFTGREGDRMLFSGTANKRGSPLHRIVKVAQKRFPQNFIEVKVQEAIDAGILSKANVESKKQENGGKLSPVEFDAWFNCKFPNVGTLAWHPLDSTLTRADLMKDIALVSAFGTGGDPGIPVSRYVIVAFTSKGEIHAIEEFEIDDLSIGTIPTKSLGKIAVEWGVAFHAGFNFPYHSMLEMHKISHMDSNVDGEPRKQLFAEGFKLQNNNKLFVNPITCPNTMRACEEQTFDENGEMDHLPLSHWIFAMLHAIRAAMYVAPTWESLSKGARW